MIMANDLEEPSIYYIDHLNKSIVIRDSAIEVELDTGINQVQIHKCCQDGINTIIEGYSFYYLTDIDINNQPRLQDIDNSLVSKQREEIWKPIPLEFLPGYEASTRGRIRYVNPYTNVISLCRYHNSSGYNNIYLKYNTLFATQGKFRVHRLIAITFVPLPQEGEFEEHSMLPNDTIPFIINHKDGIGCHNRPDNLEWCDTAHNAKHAYLADLTRNKVSCTMIDLELDQELYFNTMKDVSRCLDISKGSVIRVITSHTEVPYLGRYLFKDVNMDRLLENRNDVERKIYIKDYVTGEVYEASTLKEASIKTSVSLETISHRLFKDINSNNDLLLAGYIFRSDKDIYLPWSEYSKEEAELSRKLYLDRLSKGNVIKADSKTIEVRDYDSGAITIHNSIKDMCRELNYSYTQIHRYLRPRDETLQLPLLDGCVFRVIAYGYEWPHYTKEQAKESKELYVLSKTVGPNAKFRRAKIGKNYITGEIREFSCSKDIAAELGISVSIVDAFFYSSATKRVKPLKGWYFYHKDDLGDWPTLPNGVIQKSLS